MRKRIVNHLTGDRMNVRIPVEIARDYLQEYPPKQLETELDDDVTWFKLECTQQAVSMLGLTESICEVCWNGPGWYRTELVLEYDRNWLRLVQDNPSETMLTVRHMADLVLDQLTSLGP